MAQLNQQNNRYVQMMQTDPEIVASLGGIREVYHLQALVTEDEHSLPKNHEIVPTNDGVLVRSLRPIAKPSVLGLIVEELNKVPAAQAGPPAGTSVQTQKDFADTVARLENIGGVEATHDYGAKGRPFRTPDQEVVLGGIKIPDKGMDVVGIKRDLFAIGLDTELMVEAGRQAVEVRRGNLAAIDLSGFESYLQREKREAEEEAERQRPTKRLMTALTFGWASPSP